MSSKVKGIAALAAFLVLALAYWGWKKYQENLDTLPRDPPRPQVEEPVPEAGSPESSGGPGSPGAGNMPGDAGSAPQSPSQPLPEEKGP